MDVIKAISGRSSIRAFLPKPVSREIVTAILDAARWAPSGVNCQPWHVAVVTGKTKKQIGDAIIDARSRGVPQNPDYEYYPKEWREPYQARRKACGIALYKALGIAREDTERRREVWELNYRFFGAPIGFLFFIESGLATGAWMDMAMFVQNVMLAARGHGLETCPQASLAEYPDLVREILGLDKDRLVVCGMSMGYPDLDHPINQYRLSREPVSEFTTWYP